MDIKDLIEQLEETEYELEVLQNVSKKVNKENFKGIMLRWADNPQKAEWDSNISTRFIPSVTYEDIRTLIERDIKKLEEKCEALQQMLDHIQEKANEVLSEMKASIND